jgi:hypothetical protein
MTLHWLLGSIGPPENVERIFAMFFQGEAPSIRTPLALIHQPIEPQGHTTTCREQRQESQPAA